MLPLKRQGVESRTQALCTQLRELAYKLGPGARLPTAVELCALFTTSRTTLNDALGILEAQNVLSRRRGSGIYVSSKLHMRSFAVLLYAQYLLGVGVSPFWGQLSGLIVQEIARRRHLAHAEYIEFHYVLPSLDEKVTLPASVLAMLRAGQLHGLLTVGMDHHTYTWLEEQDIPCVAFAGYSRYSVGLEDIPQMRLAIRTLIDQGCRRLGLWTTPTWRTSSSDELPSHAQAAHFQLILAEAGLPFYPHLMRYSVITPPTLNNMSENSYQSQGYQHALAVFSGTDRSTWPDGIFISNDMLASGVLVALQQLGIQPGKDVKIISHANKGSPTLFGYTPQIQLVEFDPVEIVQAMFSLLDLVMSEDRPETRTIYIKPYLRP